ncbi:major facilitator superfamily transporter [Tritrichomonas foetus]|uniref:Major facilitator superfamily transporter n=1 Tax=Tritrichomonas foetus TaxID=1144522 RepID=A0A1J4JV13_9EUKA|nr:major facilitator superfamily transporter [Tritrichomonas foetus]|eukprot:OHT02985.1 major facilitator superfamily transporter [Tritrichomonas foetus]
MTRSFNEITNEFPGYDDLAEPQKWVPLNLRERLTIPHIIGICCSMLAYQIAYSVEFSLGTPIMTRLGIKSTLVSVIWMSGPLSGFIVQPVIGTISDVCKSKFGRRRPFILCGALGIIIGFLLIFFTEQIADGNTNLAIGIFVVALLETNIAIHVLQGPSRALIGDLVPARQQVFANTIGSIMLGVAAIVTNLIGGLKLAQYTNGVLNDEKLVFICGMILIVISVSITLLCAKEEEVKRMQEKRNPFLEIWRAFKHMPRPIFRIALVYFFSWMAYYPFNIECTDFFGYDIFQGRSTGDDHLIEKYNNGVCHGMIVIAVSNCLVLIYSPFQEIMVKKLGMKLTYAISQIIEAVCLVIMIFVTNKWALLGILAPLGISSTIFNSVPFAIVGLSVQPEQMGCYMGVLNSFAVVGQQISSFLLVSGAGAIFHNKAPIIGLGSVFAVISAILCYWIVIPKDDSSTLEPLTPSSSYYE